MDTLPWWIMGMLAHRIGLLTRVVLALTVVAVLPFLLASSQLIRINARAMTEQVLSTHTVAARAIAERVAAQLELLLRSAERLAANPVLLADPRSSGSAEVLATFLGSDPLIRGVALLSPAGDEVVRAQRRDAAAAMTGAVASREPRDRQLAVVELQGQDWLIIDVPLAGHIGWLRALVAGDWLPLLLSPVELGDEAELVIIDNQGKLVAGQDLAPFPPSLREAASSGKVAGCGRFAGKDGEILGAFFPVPGASWVVLSRQPAAVAERIAVGMRQRAVLAIAGAALLAAGLSLAAYRSLVRPLRELLAAQRRLVGLAEQPAAGTGNEIDALQQSFAILEQRIRDREDLGKVFLGRYQVVDLLGQGAMGSVFRGWDPRLKRPVALKTIRLTAALATRTAMAETLLHEAVTVARFSHPNIVAVYDLEDAGGAAYVAMELVDGPSLHQHLRQVRAMAPDQVVLLGLKVAEALLAAHSHGLVHNDIKPGNILLGHNGSVKVADFGIARFLSAMLEEQTQILGTPGYLPPETLRGEGFDEVGDLFALGVVLYEALTGVKPFAGTSLQETLKKTVSGTTTPPSRLNNQVAKNLDNAIMTMIHAEKEHRPRGAEQVVRVFRRMAEENGSEWLPPGSEQPKRVEVVTDHAGHTQLLDTTIISSFRGRRGRRR